MVVAEHFERLKIFEILKTDIRNIRLGFEAGGFAGQTGLTGFGPRSLPVG